MINLFICRNVGLANVLGISFFVVLIVSFFTVSLEFIEMIFIAPGFIQG